MFRKKEPEAKCKNCLLYKRASGTCGVVILHAGERLNVPVEPEDDCLFEGKFQVDVQQVRMWTEDPNTGLPAENGVVKIEYPVGFFGDEVPPV